MMEVVLNMSMDVWIRVQKNYNSQATKSNDSCEYYIYGCTDNDAINYNEKAEKDDGSCIKYVYGCMDKSAKKL